MTKFCDRAALILLAGATFSLDVLAEAPDYPPVSLPGTELRELRDEAREIDYRLYVSLPNGYADTEQAYPVVYVLDADYSFAIARNIVEHLSDRNHLPKAIVVGIAYGGPPAYRANRTRDYTPTQVPTGGYGERYQAVSGGAPDFRRFIEQTLIPFVEDEYRAGSRTLVGHSYGGLFTTWMALTVPQLFSGYIIVSPSLWYDDGLIFDLEASTAEARADVSARIYLTVGSREINSRVNMVEDLKRMCRLLESRGHPGIRLDCEVADDETHNSVFPRALSNGLRFVLEGR